MRKCTLCGRLWLPLRTDASSYCRPCQFKLKAERRRKRGVIQETDDLLLHHDLALQIGWTEEDQAAWSINASWMTEPEHPTDVVCNQCKLRLEFQSEEEAEYAYDKIKNEICRARQHDALTSALESIL